MTLYKIQWKEKDTQLKHTHVCSSFVKAQALLRGLNSNLNALIISDPEGNLITKHKLTGQDQVIDFINNL